MKKPVYEVEITIGNTTVTVLSTDVPKRWNYEYYVDDESAKPVGYLVKGEQEKSDSARSQHER